MKTLYLVLHQTLGDINKLRTYSRNAWFKFWALFYVSLLFICQGGCLSFNQLGVGGTVSQQLYVVIVESIVVVSLQVAWAT